jgi:hypothetical protein
MSLINNANRTALQNIEDFCKRLFPQGKPVGKYWRIGSTRGEPGDSLGINRETGVWKDFAGGDKGGDLVALMASHHGISQREAATKIMDMYEPSNGHSLPPLNAKLTEPTAELFSHRELGNPSAKWTYKDTQGQPIGYALRYDSLNKKKEIRYLVPRRERWEFGAFKEPRPLFGQESLLGRPEAPVLVVEGEKTAEAAARAFPDYNVITWPGGCGSVSKADWGILNGRNVVAWPDADTAGRDAMAKIAEHLGHIDIVDTEELPEKWDLADSPPEGWSLQRVLDLIQRTHRVQKTSNRDVVEPQERGEFPADAFPKVIRDYADSVAKLRGVPVELPLLCCLAAVGGAMGKHWELHGAVNGQSNRGNIYLLLGLPSGTGKGIANVITRPIREYENSREGKWAQDERPSLEAKKNMAEKTLKGLLDNSNSALCDEQQLISARRRLSDCIKNLNRSSSLIIGNATTSGLARELTRVDNETLFICSAEGGEIVKVMLGLYRKGVSDFELWLNGYSGEGYKQTRANSPETLVLNDICLSSLVMLQPCVMEMLITNKDAKERGLLARILFATLEVSPAFEDDSAFEPDKDAESNWGNLITNILNRRFGSNGKSPLHITCSEEARRLFRDYHNHALRLIEGDFADSQSELLRWRENALRIAIIFAVAEDPDTKILSPEIAERAINVHRHIALGALNANLAEREKQLRARSEKLIEVLKSQGGARLASDLKTRNKFDLKELYQLQSHFPHLFKIEQTESGGRPGTRVSLRER